MDDTPPAPQRTPLYDSPWFWVYLFATFALAVLLVMRPRVQERQAQIERKEQGRARAWEQAAGDAPPTPLSTPESTRFTLGPLYAILGAIWIIACAMTWRRLRQGRSAPATAVPPQPP